MKRIYQLSLIALTSALVACGTLGGGGTDMSNDPIFQQFKKANINFIWARAYAKKCLGDENGYNTHAGNAKSLEQGANTVDAVVDINNNDSADENIKLEASSSEKLSEDAKKAFETSATYFFMGVFSETQLAAVLALKVKEMQEQIQNASPMEKMSLASQLTPYADMLQIVQNDVKIAAETTKMYIDYGLAHGVDMDGVQKTAEEKMKSAGNSYTKQTN